MTNPDQMQDDAQGEGLFNLLRRIERAHPGQPRIGHSRRTADEVVTLSQEPRMGFPAADVAGLAQPATGKTQVHAQAIGYFGPQGALPLNITEEAARWVDLGDRAFVDFTNIFGTRFQQLFFRAWSDAHAISQFDAPDKDRFQGYIGALSGIGTEGFRSHDSVHDVFKTSMVPLHAARVKSPVRLRQLIEHHLACDVIVREHEPSWLEFEAADHCKLGQQGATLGRDSFLGSRVQTINERVVLEIRTGTLDQYKAYMPGGRAYDALRDVVFWYLGKTVEVGVEVALPANAVPAATLGPHAQLGFTTAVAPTFDKTDTTPVPMARYTLDNTATS